MFLAEYVPIGHAATLALLGDLMVGRGVDPTPASLGYLAPNLKAADLSLANLESPLTIQPRFSNRLGQIRFVRLCLARGSVSPVGIGYASPWPTTTVMTVAMIG